MVGAIGAAGIGLGGSAAVGTAAGVKARANDAVRMDRLVAEDLNALQATGQLPPRSPAYSLTPRKQRGMVACYALGILGSGFAVWLLTVIIATVFQMSAGEQFPAKALLGSMMIAAVLGFIAFIIPGLFVGSGLWLREVRARISDETGQVYRQFWGEREAARAALAEGRTAPQHVLALLTRFHTDSIPDEGLPAAAESQPVRGRWLGNPGERVAVAARVEQVGTTQGWDDPSMTYAHYYLRTEDGDVVSWQAKSDHRLQVGEVVLIDGQVKALTQSSTERITEVWYAQILQRAGIHSSTQG